MTNDLLVESGLSRCSNGATYRDHAKTATQSFDGQHRANGSEPLRGLAVR